MPTLTLTDSGNPDTNGLNLQGLFNQAAYGDVIVLPVRVICRVPGTSPLTCPIPRGSPPGPAGSPANYVNVQSAGLANLPQPISGQPRSGRLFSDSPSGAPSTASDVGVPANMARICHTSGANPYSWVLTNVPNAQYWKFQGIEFCPSTPTDPTWCFWVIYLGTGTYDSNSSPSGSASAAANYFFFDRCYIHAWDKQPAVKNEFFCKNLTVSGCWIDNFKTARGGIYSGDSEALYMNGPGPYSILNNFIASTHEPVFFGWGSGMSINTMPGDGGGQNLVQYNTITKRTQWLWGFPNYSNPSTWPTGGNSDNTGYFLKNLIEVKAGHHITIDHNFFQYSNDTGDQHGVCFAINLINYSASGVEQAHDIQFTNNRIDSVCAGCGFSHNEQSLPNASPGQQIKNITVKNNLFTNFATTAMNINGAQTFGVRLVMDSGTGGPGVNIAVEHNTYVLGAGSNRGPILDASTNSSTSATAFTTEQGFVFRNNIVCHGNDGWHTALVNSSGYLPGTTDNLSTLQTLWPSATVGGNILFGLGSTPTDIWSQDNSPSASQSAVGFVNGSGDLTPSNWALSSSSPYRGKGTDGTDPGCDISKLADVTTSTGTDTTTTIPNLSVAPGSAANVTVTVTALSGAAAPAGQVVLTVLSSTGNQVAQQTASVGNQSGLQGTASFSLGSSLAVDSYALSASYTPSQGSTFNGSSGSGVLKVGQPTNDVVSLTTNADANLYSGSPFDVVVAVRAKSGVVNPTGTVTLGVGNQMLTGMLSSPAPGTAPQGVGVYLFDLARGLPPGTYTVVVNYSGDSTFDPGSATATAVINPPNITTNPPTLTGSGIAPAAPLASGQDAVLLVTVTS